MPGAIPPTPQINASTNIWGFKYWIDRVQKWIKGASDTITVAPSANFNVDQDSTYLVYPVNTASGDVTATLPSAVGSDGKKYTFKNTDLNAVILSAYAGDNINGSSTYALYGQNATVSIISDGVTSWNIVDSGSSTQMGRGFRNVVVNGGMEIWQMGTSFTPGGSVAARSGLSNSAGTSVVALPDHWSMRDNSVGGIAVTFSRIVGMTNDSVYALRIQRPLGNASTSNVQLIQDIGTPNSKLIAGTTCTLSFNARCGATFLTSPDLFQAVVTCGTGINEARRNLGYTGETTAFAISVPVSINTTRFSYQVTIPSTTTEIALRFIFNTAGVAGASDYIDLDNVQLEIGSATAFESLLFEDDLNRCLSWVQKSFPYAVAPVTNWGTVIGAYNTKATKAGVVNTGGHSQSFAPALRDGAAVIAIVYNPLAANNQVRDNTAGVDQSNSVVSSGEKSFLINFRGNAATAVGNELIAHYVIDGGI